MFFKKTLRKTVVLMTVFAVVFSSLAGLAPVAKAAAPVLSEDTVVMTSTVKASSAAKVIGAFRVTNPNVAADTIDQFTIENKAALTAVTADIASVAIYSDANTLGVVDGADAVACAESTTNTTTNFDAGGAVITFTCASPVAIGGSGGVLNFLAVATTSAGATDGRTMAAKVNAHLVTAAAWGAADLSTTNAITIDTVAPVLNTAQSGPSNGATGVPISTFMHLGFKNGVSGGNEMLDQSTVNSTNITFTTGGTPVPMALRPFPDGFDIITSAPPTFAASSRFAKASTVSTGFFMMQGTSSINPQGSYTVPAAGDIVYFQHETFPGEIGIVTNATLTSGTFAVNGFNLFGGQQITKFAATPAASATGAVTEADTLTAGDLVVVNTTANPTDMKYNWHIVTTGAAVNNAALRLDGAGAAPTYVSGSSFTKLAPAATATDNGATAGNVLAVSQGDLAYLKVGTSYGWHLVTTTGNLSSDATENTAYIDGGATDPAIVANSQMSKIASAAQGPADGTDTTALSFGDMVFASTTANAANNGSYNFHLVTGSGTGIANSAVRFDNASSTLTPSTSYTITAGVGLKDSAGNALASPVTVGFTTGSTGSTNTTPPFVQSSTPQPGNQSFPINVPLKVQFSVSMSTTGGAGGTNSVTNPSNIGIYADSYGAPSGSVIPATNTYDDTTKTVTVTPTSNLTASTAYVLKVAPSTQSSTGAAMNEFRLYFKTASGTGTDTTKPRVLGVYPATAATGVAKNAVISIGFSEDMDQSTISASTVTVSGSISGTVSYSPSNKTAYFTPSQPFADNTLYTVTVTSSATDLAGLNLDQVAGGGNDNFTSTFTTGSAAISAATVMSANADNFGVAITFSQAMKVGGGPNAADYINNYSLESPVGSSISLGGKTVTYDGSTMTARISGLSLQNGNTYKVTVGNLTQDISGTGISTSGTPAGNIAQGTVMDSSQTGGQLGPGSGPAQTGAQMGMTPINVMPMNRAAGATSNYSVEFPVTTSIPAGGSIVLTFPAGFDVTNAAKATAGTESFRNGDINGPMDGTVTMGVLANNASARTITIPTAGAATGANSFISFDLKTIVNSTLPSDTGYTVDIKTKGTDGAILETKTSNPFFLGQTGSSTLTVNVFNDNGAGGGTAANNIKDGTEAGIANAMVFIFSPAAGGQNSLTNGSGVATFASLSDGDYMLGLDPKSLSGTAFAFNSAPQPITVSGNTTKNFGLTAAPYTITGTIYGPASTSLDVFASSMNGFVKVNVTTNSTPVTYPPVTGTSYGGSVTYSLSAQANTTYQVGVGPAMPDTMMMPGAPPPPPPTFTFMPPPNQEVIVTTASVANKHFALTATNKTIAGTVKDSAGTGINGAMIFARPVASSTTGAASGMGTGGQTDAAGNFTLSVVPGVYLVGAFKPGMPSVQDKQITVPSSGANTPASLNFVMDFNSSSALTISGTIKDDSGNAIPYAGVSGRKVVSTADTTPVGGGGDNFVGGPTNSNGGYTLYVTAGTWVIEAFAPGFGKLGTKTITISTSSMSGQDFSAQTMSIGTITGQATKATVAQQGVMVRVEGANGGNMTVTDVSGNYSIKVPAGTYTIKCMFPGVGESTPLTGVVVTASATTASQDCSLAAPITITVNITDGTNPITNAFVDARDSNGRGNGTGVSSTSGINAVYTLVVPPGTYTVRAGHPAYGMIGSTSSVSSTQAITYTATSGQMYAVTGTVTGDGSALSSAWVSLYGTPSGQTNMVHLGGQTNASGVFSVSMPNGVYRYRADKPGYKSPAEGIVTVNGATIDVGTIALTTASRTITGTVTLSSAGVSNAFVDASDGQGGFAVSQTDAAGAYTLAVDNGTWTLRAHSMGYEGGPLSVTVNNNSPSGQTIALSAISGFTMRPEKQETMTPTSGGFLTNTDIGSNFKLNIPANALGTSSNASTVTTQSNTAVPNPPAGTVLAKNAVKISAVDSSGQPIKTLNDDVTITVPYTEADIPAGSSENSLVLGVWNEATQSYDTLSTIVDVTANTLTATTSHFSDFAPLIPASGAPSTPTGLAATAASSSQINLTWTQTSGATSYDIYRSNTSGGTFTRLGSEPTVSSGSTTTYSNTGLSAGTTYYYKISAINASGESAASSEVSATTSSSGGGGGGASVPTISSVTSSSVSINGGAGSTSSLAVTLTLTATNATQMAISNTADFAGVVWETFSTSKTWSLVSGDGVKTVYAKFRDAAGVATGVVLDTITLGAANGTSSTSSSTVSTGSQTSYPDGTLIKASDAPEVYVIRDGNKVWVKTAEEFNAAGYKWADIKVVSGEILKAVGSVKLIRVAGDPRVYVLHNNIKKHIKTAEEFSAAGYKWENIVSVSQTEADSYADDYSNGGKTITISSAWLRVRGSNTTKSAELGRVNNNENYSVLDEKNGWYKIATAEGVTGWVSGAYVKVKTESASVSSGLSDIVINTPYLRIRSINSTGGKMLGIVKKGAVYSVIEENNGWYKIKTNSGVIGWVLGSYTLKR